MKKTAVICSLILAGGVVLGIIGDRVLNANQDPVKSTLLIRTTVGGVEEKEARVVLVEFSPGAAVRGKHYHPGNEIVYVLDGSVILEVQGRPPVTFRQGEIFQQPPGQVHTGRNASATAVAKLLQFLIVDKDGPAAVPVKQGKLP